MILEYRRKQREKTFQNTHELHLMLADMDSLISCSVRDLIIQHKRMVVKRNLLRWSGLDRVFVGLCDRHLVMHRGPEM